jgi:protein gp37
MSYHRRRVFLGSLMDWLDPEVPAEWLADALDVIRQCPELEFLCVTKRPELFKARRSEVLMHAQTTGNMRLLSFVFHWGNEDGPPQPPPNVTILASVEDQRSADERIPALLRIPAVRHCLSIEPLIGPVLLERSMAGYPPRSETGASEMRDVLRWVIVGGESGPRARPCNVEWIRDIVRQCKEASVPCFVKQVGSNVRDSDRAAWPVHLRSVAHQQRIITTHPKGGDPTEWPEDLRVREFPEGLR